MSFFPTGSGALPGIPQYPSWLTWSDRAEKAREIWDAGATQIHMLGKKFVIFVAQIFTVNIHQNYATI